MMAYRDIILRDGFTIIPKFLSATEVAELQKLNHATLPEKGHHVNLGWQPTDVYPKIEYQHYWSVQIKDQTEWLQEKLHPIISDIMQECYSWFAVDFHVANPGSDYIHAHIDSPYQFRPWHENTELLGVQCLIAVEDFTLENGATCIVPGSHNNHYPMDKIGSDELNNEMLDQGYNFVAPAGSILLYHPRSLHSTMPNYSSAPRTAMLMLAIRPDIWTSLLSYHGMPKKQPCVFKKVDGCTRWPVCICARDNNDKWNSAGEGNFRYEQIKST